MSCCILLILVGTAQVDNPQVKAIETKHLASGDCCIDRKEQCDIEIALRMSYNQIDDVNLAS